MSEGAANVSASPNSSGQGSTLRTPGGNPTLLDHVPVIKMGRHYSEPEGEMAESFTSKDYIDRSMDAVRAQNDARFAEVLAQIGGIGTRLDAIERSQFSPWHVWGAALTGFLGVLAILAFGGDQFGLGSSLADQRLEQLERDKAQTEKIDAVLNRVDAFLAAQATQPAPAPGTPSE